MNPTFPPMGYGPRLGDAFVYSTATCPMPPTAAIQLPPLYSQRLDDDSCQGWLDTRDGQTIQDRVRLMDTLCELTTPPPIKLLAKLIPGGWQDRQFFTNGTIFYALSDMSVAIVEPAYFMDQTYASSMPRNIIIPVNAWTNRVTGQQGRGAFSFVRHFGADIERARAWIAEELGISINCRDVQQMGLAPGDVFIDSPDLYGACSPSPHPVLGLPKNATWFTSAFGKYSFLFANWAVNSQFVGLFCTLVLDAKLRLPVWKFVRPPAEAMLFNLHRILDEPSLPVYVFESLETAGQYQETPGVVATWAGGTDIVHEIGWGRLAGRDVTYFFDQSDYDSVVVGHELKKIFNQLGAELKVAANG